MNVLDRLVGQEVTGVHVGEGVVSLLLSKGVLAAFNPISGVAPGRLEGRRIEGVSLVDGERLSLAFDNGSVFHISLRDGDYSGPEAFEVDFADGTTVVGQ